jgi:hypothetical protein
MIKLSFVLFCSERDMLQMRIVAQHLVLLQADALLAKIMAAVEDMHGDE